MLSQKLEKLLVSDCFWSQPYKRLLFNALSNGGPHKNVERIGVLEDKTIISSIRKKKLDK